MLAVKPSRARDQIAHFGVARDGDTFRVGEFLRVGVPDILRRDSARFRERAGWRPAIPVERARSDTLDYWREHVTNSASRPPGAQTEAPQQRGRAPGPSEGFARARSEQA